MDCDWLKSRDCSGHYFYQMKHCKTSQNHVLQSTVNIQQHIPQLGWQLGREQVPHGSKTCARRSESGGAVAHRPHRPAPAEPCLAKPSSVPAKE